MVKFMTAAEAYELTLRSKHSYEKAILEGERFKSIAKNIEQSAEKGKNNFRVNSFHSDDLKEFEFIKTTLENAGYKVELKQNLPIASNTATYSLTIVW